MSAGQEDEPKRDEGPGDEPRRSSSAAGRLGPLPRPLALALLLAWALATIAAFTSVLRGPAPWSGELEGLVPGQHRNPEDRTLVLLRVDLDALEPEADDEAGLGPADPRAVLAEAGFAIEEAFGDERVPSRRPGPRSPAGSTPTPSTSCPSTPTRPSPNA